MMIPVILAGGTGTRLWPVSRKSFPKQFTELLGDESLFQVTARRLSGPEFTAPTVMTNSDFRFIVAEQLDGVGQAPGHIMIEPEGRNTAPAILAAALAHKSTPDAIMVVSPSDHAIGDEAAFYAALHAGQVAAKEGQLVTFGICPSRPETGYGYLALAQKPKTNALQAYPLEGFVEKPQPADAEAMIASGNYLWNAGIFMFRVDAILEAFKTFAPQMFSCVVAALEGAKTDLCFTRLAHEPWGRCDDISIDYAVMEKAETLSVVPMDCGWSDMGSWQSVWTEGPQDTDGNVLSGNATALECSNTMLRSEDENIAVVGMGLEDLTVVATGDAVLVTKTGDSEGVKQAVAELKRRDIPQATDFQRCHRPWGYYETLSLGRRFQVKRIMVNPGAALSLQSHVHRAEHWVVVEGSANVTIDDSVKLVSENQSVYIPLGAVHRLQNPGKVPLHLIEVQSGAYLGEDDIIRYEDVYDRTTEAA